MNPLIVTAIICVAVAVVFVVLKRRRLSGNDIALSEHDRREMLRTFVPQPPTAKPAREDRPMPPRGSLAGEVHEIEYADGDGVVTKRVIRVNSVEDARYFAYLHAYCYLADDVRTFRSDRILSMTDHRTGDRIADPTVYFLSPPQRASSDPAHVKVMARAKGGLIVLIWIARAEPRLDADTYEVLFGYIEDRLALGGAKAMEATWDRGVAWQAFDDLRPNFDNVAGALARIPTSGKEPALVSDYISRLAAMSDKRRKRADRVLRLIGRGGEQ